VRIVSVSLASGAAFVLGACGDNHGTADAGADARTGALTLDNCPTTYAMDVPAVYRPLFRCVDVSVSGTDLVIATPGLPPHPSYYYEASDPNHEAWDDRGGAYHPNPNSLRATPTTFTIPLAPVSRGLTITAGLVDGVVNTSGSEYRGGPVGVGLDSVLMFDALAAPGDDIAAEQYTFDEWNGHPAPSGAYHYHSGGPGPLSVLARIGITTSATPGSATVEVFGVMCDGTFVLGCTELDGSTPDQAGLDAQNGHVHDLVDGNGAVLAARYHVHLCPSSWTAHPRPYTPEIQYYDRCTVR
jgi:YHYH protein